MNESMLDRGVHVLFDGYSASMDQVGWTKDAIKNRNPKIIDWKRIDAIE